jgi:hypothetical protein
VVNDSVAASFAHGNSQSSTSSPGTRQNSVVLCVTSVQLFVMAMAAI